MGGRRLGVGGTHLGAGGTCLAAGRTPGMPATPETLADLQAKGCRYIYTHLPRLLGLGASAFLTSLSPLAGRGSG